MSTKLDPGKFDWYAAALPDEPYFIVLARDNSAPRIVRDWADRRELEISQGERPASDMDKVNEARDTANLMELWRATNYGRWLERPVSENEVQQGEGFTP